ncbi:hypothetical protein H4219_000832 [Mycoemilia scoparia]|uniref:Cell division cycle protein 123 homolog n=1 Tax=Mycoemilia scoparia TaxID=417184 RepID=A0A9W8A8B5_9FUNG|nr:hypothetical protein H4219_000832 [Mycoemilia scoparia]
MTDPEFIDIEFKEITENDLIKCSFSQWYPLFKAHTFKSEIIKPLSPEFIDYLLSDGIFIPDQDELPSLKTDWDGFDDPDDEIWKSDNKNENSGSDDDDDEEEEEKDIRKTPDLTETTNAIREIISRLGGSVFPRMNWNSPKDAAWMALGNTLKSCSPSEIYLLLKSSDKITKDLFDPVASNGINISSDEKDYDTPKEFIKPQVPELEPELVLRQWGEIHRSMEFRCFVKSKKIIGISQMDLQHYDHLFDSKDEISSCIHDLFDNVIRDKFELENYCFDAYVKKNLERAYLVDFNFWAPNTDPILFTWPELVKAKEDLGLVLVTRGRNVTSGITSRYSQNRFPIELNVQSYHKSLLEMAQRVQKEQGAEASKNQGTK